MVCKHHLKWFESRKYYFFVHSTWLQECENQCLIVASTLYRSLSVLLRHKYFRCKIWFFLLVCEYLKLYSGRYFQQPALVLWYCSSHRRWSINKHLLRLHFKKTPTQMFCWKFCKVLRTIIEYFQVTASVVFVVLLKFRLGSKNATICI